MPYRSPRDLADQVVVRRRQAKAEDGYARETFTQPRDQARQTARAFLDQWPAAAYISEVESWRELPSEKIFTPRFVKPLFSVQSITTMMTPKVSALAAICLYLASFTTGACVN